MKTSHQTKDIKTHELLAGKYRVEGRIATGGMGKIYRALQGEFDRRVAVKIIDMDQLTPEMQARFRREMKTLIDLEVPNVIAIYDYDQFRGHDFYVMPLLQGGTLSQRIEILALENRPAPSAGEVNQRLQLLAQALYRVHQKGIIHRDIKPSNIMFDEHGQPFIIDFGIAREANPEFDLTQVNVIIGTLPYMCLDQLNGKKPTPSFDIYALGVVIYQTLNGSFPFKSQIERNDNDYRDDLRNSDALFQAWRTDLPENLKQVFRKALSQDPTQQYPDMLAFAADFAAASASLSSEDTGFFTFSVPQAAIDIHDLPSTMHKGVSLGKTTVQDNQPSSFSKGLIAGLVIFAALIGLFVIVWVLRSATLVTPITLIPTLALSPTSVAVEPSKIPTQFSVTEKPSEAAAGAVISNSSSTPSPVPTVTPQPTTLPPTFTPAACEVMLNGGLGSIDQWKASACAATYEREDAELGVMMLVPCLTNDTSCKPIWVNKYEITRGQGNLDTDINLPWTNVGASRATSWCGDRQGRLLTVQEWQNASGAAMKFIFPWGTDPRDDYPLAGKAYDAKTYLADASWSGVIGMGGNVAEWVQGGQRMGSHFRSADKFRIDYPPEPLSKKDGDSTVGIRCAQDWSPKTN